MIGSKVPSWSYWLQFGKRCEQSAPGNWCDVAPAHHWVDPNKKIKLCGRGGENGDICNSVNNKNKVKKKV